MTSADGKGNSGGTSYGAESAIVRDDGTRLARALTLDRVLRSKCLPVTVSAPWGLTIATGGSNRHAGRAQQADPPSRADRGLTRRGPVDTSGLTPGR